MNNSVRSRNIFTNNSPRKTKMPESADNKARLGFSLASHAEGFLLGRKR